MAKIAIIRESYSPFQEEQYIVDTSRGFDGRDELAPIYKKGDLICECTPFFGVPLRLEIAIRVDGNIVFRSWQFVQGENHYLHTHKKPRRMCEAGDIPFDPTPEQIDTVNGLFSGRIKWEGLKLAVGATLQDVCPINVKREEELTNQRIYLT